MMFSTFTGSSRRPRNVNLSGTAGNPFSNTTWTPSAASNTTKTVHDAQAEREKRHQERLRVKAAGRIQRTWRGHTTRQRIAVTRREAFDDLYRQDQGDAQTRLAVASGHLAFFFSSGREGDLTRAVRFAHDGLEHGMIQAIPPNATSARGRRLFNVFVKTLEQLPTTDLPAMTDVLELLLQIIKLSPSSARSSLVKYYGALARLYQTSNDMCYSETLEKSLTYPLQISDQDFQRQAYTAIAFEFMIRRDITLFEKHLSRIANSFSLEKLSVVIVDNYSTIAARKISRDGLLYLVAHFVDLGRTTGQISGSFAYLSALHTQIACLSSDINQMLAVTDEPTPSTSGSATTGANHNQNYVSVQLRSLTSDADITRLLKDFSATLGSRSQEESTGTSLLSGYILSLLQSFPSEADEVRMRLFREHIPTRSGDVPVVKFLGDIMRRTSVFQNITTESVQPIDMLRLYLKEDPAGSSESVEDQEWQVILLFLELYVFILRLSDDEDFFSGIYSDAPQISSSVTTLRACSLPLSAVQSLTLFLKNVAFTLYYRAYELSKTEEAYATSTEARFLSYLGSVDRGASSPSSVPDEHDNGNVPRSSNKTSIGHLQNIVTAAMKMLYERDSRKPFLPPEHWLMTHKMDTEDFISAVLLEEQRQLEEEDSDSDDVDDDSQADDPLIHGNSWAAQHARRERLKAQQRRAQREHRRAEMGPKLEILRHMPFAVPFDTRVKIFRAFVDHDRSSRGYNVPLFINPQSRHQAQIRRGQLFADAYDAFYKLGEGIKDPIQITFVDQFGAREAGIDGGGVTKEFLTRVTAEAFGNETGGLEMFSTNQKGLLYPNPALVDIAREAERQMGYTELDQHYKDTIRDLLRRYEFLGRIVGKCMYEGILVDLAFAGFFLLKWPSPGPKQENSYKGSINDLRDMDEELYNGLLRLKNYDGNVIDLGFDFTVEDQISPPDAPVKTVNKKLISHGDQVAVTNDNRLLYSSYVARHRLVVQPSLQTSAFLRGLRTIIRTSWLSMFNQSELQRLIGGDSSEIDVEDLRQNTVYSGLYEIGDDQQEHPTIELFWKVMHSFTDKERRDVVKYVSSTPRAPLLGFSQLRPKFSIRDAGTDQTRLPSTSTCVNLLKLPLYLTEDMLREKLLYAVQSGAGFDLS